MDHESAKAVVLRVASEAGLQLINESSNEQLCVYFDVLRDGKDIGCLSRGWTDPGFRLSEQIEMAGGFGNPLWFPSFIEFGATNGVAVSCNYENDVMTVALESVLYDEGFNPSTLAHAIEALLDCKLQLQRIKYWTAAEMFGRDHEPFWGDGTLH